MISTLAARGDRPGRLVLAALLLGLSACKPEFTLTGDVQIRCVGADDCPEKTRCSAAGLCVSSTTGDTDGPKVTLVGFERDKQGTSEWRTSDTQPTSLGPSAGLRVHLEVDEELLVAPKVTLGSAGEELRLTSPFVRSATRFDFVLGEGGEDAGSGEVPWDGDAGEARGEGDSGLGRGGKGGGGRRPEGVYTVWASLIDRSGNPTQKPLGTVEFDYTNPAVVADTVSVTLTPAPGNPLSEVKEVADGTRIQLAFTLSEKIPEESRPKVTTDLGAGGLLDFQYVASQGNTFVYRADFTASASLETCPRVIVRAVDAAGNGETPDGVADFPVVLVPTPEDEPVAPHLCFDTLAPEAPGAEAQLQAPGCDPRPAGRALTYRRVSWGRGGADPEFRVQGPDCALERDRTVIAFDHATRGTAAELGRGRSTSTGALDLALSLGDRERVWVAAADDAGNLSPLRLVEHVEFVASLGRKVAGSRLQNPTVFSTTALLEPTLAQDPSLSAELGDEGLAGLYAAGGGLVLKGGEQAWRRRSHPGDGPVARTGAAAAFDTWRGRWVLFGGRASDGRPLQDVWEYEPASGAWADRTPAGTRPAARHGHAAVFDRRRGKVVVYGGAGSSVDAASADCSVWEWDGQAGLWTQRPAPSAVLPLVRLGHAMAYDPESGLVFLLGGHLYTLGGHADRNDLWTWDPRKNAWATMVYPAGATLPEPRSGHAMAYDPVTRAFYLHGGRVGGAAQRDFWSLDPVSKAFAKLADSPSPRSGHSLVSIPEWGQRERVLLLGGDDGASLSSGLGWVWDGSWKAVGTLPSLTLPAREDFVAGFDPVSNRVLVFGGAQVTPGVPGPTQVLLGDTLDASLDAAGADWTQRSPRDADPPARSGQLLAPAGPGRAILFGGQGPSGALDDTCFWDARAGAWERSSDPGPSKRWGLASAAKVGPSNVVFAFGGKDATGELDEAWSWEPSAGWVQASKGASWPAARKNASMVWDSRGGGQLVLFGGSAGATSLSDTWTSADGRTWTEHPASGPWPDAREGASLSALPDGRVVLFGGKRAEGGVDLYDPNLWEWDGAGKWILRGPGPTVSGSVQTRWGATLFPSLERGRLLLFGGEKGSAMQDPWELDPGSSLWTSRGAFATPPPRAFHAMAAMGERALLFGGANGTKAWGDTWEWDPASGGRPAAIWRVPVPEAARYESLSVRFWAGGRGRDASGLETTGAQLLRWDVRTDGWQPLGENAAASAPAELLSADLGEDEILHSLLGDEREVCLAVRPLGANLTSPQMAEVGIDYVELTLRYQASPEP